MRGNRGHLGRGKLGVLAMGLRLGACTGVASGADGNSEGIREGRTGVDGTVHHPVTGEECKINRDVMSGKNGCCDQKSW